MTPPINAGERMPGGPAAPPPRRPPPHRPRFRWLRRFAGFAAGVLLLVAAAGALVGWHSYERISADLPTLDGLRNYQPRVMSRVYAGDSRLIAELASERRIFVPLSAVPDLVKDAFVAAEDQKFWVHNGVDPLAILRAAWMDVQQMGQGRRPIGASTITQQVAKNMLLGSNEVSLARKLKEALLALRIEETLSKERILELYLNEIYLGLGSYGVAAAAQTYFDKPLDELTVAEAAFLGALPKAPNNYNPFRFPDAARARRDWVIDRMAETRAITEQAAREAKAQPIRPGAFHRPETVPGAEWFGEEVRRQLVDRFGVDGASTSGLTVHTSLDPALQLAADRTMREGLMAYDRRHGGWRGPVARLDAGPAFRAGWETELAAVARPPGMLSEWRLAAVLEATPAEARLAWLERVPGQSASAADPRTGVLHLADLGWARAAHDGELGPAPRRVTDVLRPGDVVMVEPAAERTGRGERLQLRQIPVVQGALVSLDPASGRVLAMFGGWSFEASQFNRATQANRQPGSSFKPMVYLTALEQNISPSQRFLDVPFVLDQGAAGQWRPNNYEMTFNGPTPLHVALEKSLNLVTVRVADRIGMGEIARTAIAFHVVDAMPKVLPAALGAVDTTVLRQAGAYASLDAGGREVLPSLIDSVQDRDGHVIWRAPGLDCGACEDPGTQPKLDDTRQQIADPESVFQLVTMMQGVVNRGTGIEAGRGLGRPIAGKTGTSQDFNDAWFVGFTPDLVTAVWIGFDTPQSLGEKETGGAIAAPIWHDFMSVALRDRPVLQFRMPEGLTMARWDCGAGSCIDAFKPGQEPGASGSVAAANGEAPPAQGGAPSPGPAAAGGDLDSNVGGLY